MLTRSYRWFRARAVPVRDAQGGILKWYGTCSDIHDSKVLEQSIRENAIELERMVESRTAALRRSLLGVESAAPNFSRVVVRPHLGTLKFVEGTVPHPRGLIEVRVEAAGNVSVTTPVEGEFLWRGQRHNLRAGDNRFTVA